MLVQSQCGAAQAGFYYRRSADVMIHRKGKPLYLPGSTDTHR